MNTRECESKIYNILIGIKLDESIDILALLKSSLAVGMPTTNIYYTFGCLVDETCGSIKTYQGIDHLEIFSNPSTIRNDAIKKMISILSERINIEYIIIIKILSECIEGGSPRYGLCNYFQRNINKTIDSVSVHNSISDTVLYYLIDKEFTATMVEACNGWEHFSGDNNYPIKPQSNISSKEAFYEAKSKYSGEYGRRRIELAQRMIDIINTKFY